MQRFEFITDEHGRPVRRIGHTHTHSEMGQFSPSKCCIPLAFLLTESNWVFLCEQIFGVTAGDDLVGGCCQFPFGTGEQNGHAMVAGWMALENWTELNWKTALAVWIFSCFCCFPFQKVCCVSRARIFHIGGLQLLLVFLLLLLLLLHKVTSKVRQRVEWWFSLGGVGKKSEKFSSPIVSWVEFIFVVVLCCFWFYCWVAWLLRVLWHCIPTTRKRKKSSFKFCIWNSVQVRDYFAMHENGKLFQLWSGTL